MEPQTRDRTPTLTNEIARADRAGLVDLVNDHLAQMTVREVLQVLRHPFASRDVVELIATARAFRSNRGVRRAIALHPLSPRHEALHGLDDLPWRDLLDIGRETRISPVVRQVANRKIVERLPRLALGEKISLARFADRSLFPLLLAESDVSVLSALLRNPRLGADDLVTWLNVGNPLGRLLAYLASDKAWMQRPTVRAALMRNRATPRAAALSLVSACSRRELRALAEEPGIDPLLAACAQDLLDAHPAPVDRAPGAP